MKTKSHLNLLLIAVIGVMLFVLTGYLKQNQYGRRGADQVRNNQFSNLPACDPKGPVFDTIPMELTDFKGFRPLGFLNVPIHLFGAKHSNFTINLPGEYKSGLPVKFPSDATVTNIVSTEGKTAGYQLNFYPCREFKSYIFHLGTISDKLLAEFKKGKPSCQTFNFGDSSGPIKKCELNTAIKVKSGELVGTSDNAAGVDFGAVDYRITHTFANPKRYDGDYPHYVSPVPYFTPKLRKLLEDKLASWDGTVKRTLSPIYGTIAQDIPGTAQGNWFIGDKSFQNVQDFSPFLALVHDYIDPRQPVFSMGNSVKGLRMGLYSFRPLTEGLVNRDFSAIKADGKMYCYDNFLSGQTAGKLFLISMSGRLLLTMPTATTLKIEYQNMSCSAGSYQMTENATTFER